jgi:hypothetical protein
MLDAASTTFAIVSGMTKTKSADAGQIGEFMTNGVQVVFELSGKLQHLFEWANNNDLPLISTRAIERAIGINHVTLHSNMNKCKMSQANQMALADAFGFDVAWPEWRDANATRLTPRSQRRDTVEAFMARFVAEKSSNDASLTIAANTTCNHIDRRFADFAFGAVAVRRQEDCPRSIAMAVKLSFDRRGWQVLFEDAQGVFTIWLRQADLQVFHERESAKIDVFPLAQSNGMQGNFRGNVEGVSPWWVLELATDDPWLAGKRLPSDGPDCVCHGFHAGDSIRAVLTARVSDCLVGMEGELFEGLSPTKSLLIKHLAKLCVLKNAEAVLCEQTLTVVKKP